MGLLDRLRGKKEEKEAEEVKVEESLTDLEEICRGDPETYEALLNTMFLDPKKIDVSMGEAAEKARKFEKDGDAVRAKVWYEIAGGLAIYKGDVKQVKKYFGKCEKISPKTKYPILQRPKEAVAKAKEYYQKHLQDET